jgi:hypothetical protein
MKLYVDIAEVDHLIILAIEETPLDADNKSGEQSDVWEKVYKALNLLRSKAVDLHTVAKTEGCYCRDLADAEHTSEYM